MISIVMSVLNGELYLREAIDSILAQSFSDFEFIIINDGSQDATPEILRSYAGKDPRIRLYDQENAGLVSALNRGCTQARGKYIARMDADDIALPHRLRQQYEFMEAHTEVGMVGGAVQFIDNKGQSVQLEDRILLSNNELQRELLERCVFWHPTVIVRTAVFRAVGGYRRVLDAEDYDLWLRIAERAELANVPSVLLKYRFHSTQVSASKRYQQMLGAIAAGMSAKSRRSGLTDPLDTMSEVSVPALLNAGASESVLEVTLARGYLTFIRNMYRSKQYRSAISMFEESKSIPRRHVPSWIAAESYLLAGRAHWHDHNLRMSAINLARAIAARPAIVATPLRRFTAN
jgi:glycosyltransferase involved in cell wall biosynthesis